MQKIKIGIIGCGNIVKAYMNGCRLFDILDVVACADIDMAKAEAVSEEFQVPAMPVEQLLAHPEITLVVNLTIPAVHAQVNTQILDAGKHAYTEKPFATGIEAAERVIEKAKSLNLLVGSAPDTFLGGGAQTCRKLIDDGWIGKPIGFTAFMAGHGMESWHPNPEFFFKPGGGPMLDVGPYYVTGLVNLLGPVKQVCGFTTISFPERVVTSEPHYGQRIVVETPTHYTGAMEFVSGVTGVIITSFDMWNHHLPRIEIYGTEGTLSVPDPNTFGGPVSVYRAGREPGEGDFAEIPLSHIYTENCRGLGVADMAYALRSGRPHRASGELAYHVLEVMLSFEKASASGAYAAIQSTCKRPAALPLGLRYGTLDDRSVNGI